jgi:5-formyltetrahydrofolate cyclo-ligase
VTSIDEEKRALRALVRGRMPRPGSPEQVAASVAAQSRLASSELFLSARMIALYRALPSECGTAALAAQLEASGREICYPVVTPGAARAGGAGSAGDGRSPQGAAWAGGAGSAGDGRRRQGAAWADSRALSFRRGHGPFVSGALGIEEPTGNPVPLQDIDVVVVPAIAVDERGGRIGRGRGHYDATLALCRATSIALVFEAQLVPRVPLGEHDRPVRYVCTESRLIPA